MTKPIIRLWEHAGTGIILKYPSGVIYSNQAGGTSCLQPQLEGVFVPFGNDISIPEHKLISAEHELLMYFEESKHKGTGACNGIDWQDADYIDELLHTTKRCSWVSVDRDLLNQSMEAWVWVKCEPNPVVSPSSMLQIAWGFGLPPWCGVLTWANSD